ncbi:uncharacterized protein BYT42DRAFT_563623 [Radiomyces spectabilis]|uniref:uncharacterized protein n=1 Tax=Radiomyces spectabilis TaxID=64574 RepID=UPI00222027DC|nr:uncharacterized protein BYT42DRAFT_563623 [Radiomyces spectabilis]KAI8384772.1 hypothetical protein BYT42DRAFT_563623 [Radiomyces spectabilis]
MTKIHIFTDKSPISENTAKLLKQGVESVCGSKCKVYIKDLAQTPTEAGKTDYDEVDATNFKKELLKADAFLFSTTGSLSVFEKHYLHEDSSVDRELPLKGKKFAVIMTNKTTFDGPQATGTHALDHRLLERLIAHGLSQSPALMANPHDGDNELVAAGRRFAEDLCGQN